MCAPTSPTSASSTASRVLIVDDDVRNDLRARVDLEARGMGVAYAETGAEGIELLQARDDIDLVLLDIDDARDGQLRDRPLVARCPAWRHADHRGHRQGDARGTASGRSPPARPRLRPASVDLRPAALADGDLSYPAATAPGGGQPHAAWRRSRGAEGAPEERAAPGPRAEGPGEGGGGILIVDDRRNLNNLGEPAPSPSARRIVLARSGGRGPCGSSSPSASR